jgi:hypothetical protein
MKLLTRLFSMAALCGFFFSGVAVQSSPVPANVPPKVEIVSPLANAAVTAGDFIKLTAQTSDVDGHVVSVEFFANDRSIGKGTATPTADGALTGKFVFFWTNAPVDTYSLSAKAVDDKGASTASIRIPITVKPAPGPFTVKILDPVENGIYATGDEISLMATASQPILYSEFFANGHSIGVGETFPRDSDRPEYSSLKEWELVPAGTYAITAEAVAANGQSVFSEPVHIVVREGGNEVSVKIVQPENGAVFQQGDPIAILASTGLTPVVSVEFFAGDRSLGRGIPVPTFAPGGLYQLIWLNATPGEYSLTAKATDSEGDFALSDPIRITVQAKQEPLSIKVTSPENGTTFAAGSDIALVASTGKQQPPTVEFFANEKLLGKGIPLPTLQFAAGGIYQFIWKAVPAGTYSIVAAATTTDGIVAKSEPVMIHVGAAGFDFEAAFFEANRPSDGISPIFHRKYNSVNGEVEGRPLLPAMLVIPDGNNRYYYGCQDQDVYKVDSQTGKSELLIPKGTGVPELSWPMGVTYDSKRNRLLLASLGGEGFLYSYAPDGGVWKKLASMDNRDVDCLVYSPTTDSLFAVATFSGENVPGRLYELGPEGALKRTLTLPAMPFSISPGAYHSALIAVGTNLALMVEAPILAQGTPNAQSRIYQIDPKTGTVQLTFQKVWPVFPPAQHLQTVEIVNPHNGATFSAGGDLTLTARVSAGTSRVASVGFFGNGTSLGKALPQVENSTTGLYSLVWKTVPPGNFTIIAKAVSEDGFVATSTGVNLQIGAGPGVNIVAPESGATFPAGSIISLRASGNAADDSGITVEFFANDRSIGMAERVDLNPTRLGTYGLEWKNVLAGSYIVRAKATDRNGFSNFSEPIKITVSPKQEALLTARRVLPPGYVLNAPFTVQISVVASTRVAAYSIADQPPKGWKVSGISHNGVFDSSTGKVKFGPFYDHEERTLTYMVAPAQEATGEQRFGGIASANGVDQEISGNAVISSANVHHPADVNSDFVMNQTEVTAYAAAWRNGEPWSIAPNPIPESYVTRAASLWRSGERFLFNPSLGAAPNCWVPVVQPIDVKALSAAVGAVESRAVRSLSILDSQTAGVAIEVALQPGVHAYAVEEELPDGMVASKASADGTILNDGRLIHWGPFMDAIPRVLTYNAHASGDIRTAVLFGTASFDGSTDLTGGQSSVSFSVEPTIKIEDTASGIVLKVDAATAHTLTVESTDSVGSNVWVPVQVVQPPELGTAEITIPFGSTNQRFYRIRID